MPADAPKIKKLEPNDVTLTWKPGQPDPLTYIVEKRDKGKDEWDTCKYTDKTSVKLDRPDKECEYRIKAKNEWGCSDPTKSVKVPEKGNDMFVLFSSLLIDIRPCQMIFDVRQFVLLYITV